MPENSRSILLISDSYPPVLGGSEVEAQRVAVGLIRRGHRVRVLCSGGGPMPKVRDWIDPCGVPVSILTRNSTGRLKDVIFALSVAGCIWRGRRETDFVYFLMQGLHLAVSLPVVRWLRLPTVMKVSGSGIIPMLTRSFVGRLELRWLQKWAARIMVLNEGMVEESLATGFRREQLVWMPNPVDIEQFRPSTAAEIQVSRERFGIPAEAGVVVYTGRLSPEKGLKELIRGFAEAYPSTPAARLLLIGDGPSKAELQELCRSLNLGPEIVIFAGRVQSTAIPEVLGCADVFALTSPNEGFSCALLEAMSCGLPSVVSDIPANRQLIQDGVHGLTVDQRNPASVGNALGRLLNDESMRGAMGKASRDTVSALYSTDRVIDRYDAMFDEVIAELGA